MRIASLSELKKELKSLPQDELLAICLRLARFKKDSKELLHYLLLESDDESGYVSLIKSDITEGLDQVNRSSLYFAKKTIRKVLRIATKQVRYSGNKQSEVEVLMFYCQSVIELKLPMHESKVLMNLMATQIKKIKKALTTLHEDLQFDYSHDLEQLDQWFERKVRLY